MISNNPTSDIIYIMNSGLFVSGCLICHCGEGPQSPDQIGTLRYRLAEIIKAGVN